MFSHGPTQNRRQSSASSPAQPQLPTANKSCRIFDMNAINAPGVVYKAVSVAPDMSARELIQQ